MSNNGVPYRLRVVPLGEAEVWEEAQARGLAKISRQHESEPSEMVQKIVGDWLFRRGVKA